MSKALYIVLNILVLSLCSPPPLTPEPMEPIIAKFNAVVKNDHNNSTFKRLQSEESPTLKIENSKVTINFYENYKTIEHQLIVAPFNSNAANAFTYWSFSISADGISTSDITNTCQIKKDGRNSEKDCTKSLDTTTNSDFITFNYEFFLEYNEKLYITYSYNKMKTSREILYIQEAISVPIIRNSLYCDYKFIIPDGYIYIGTKNGYLTKESDKTYKFNGDCSSDINDIIRFSPEKAWWKAEMKYSLESSSIFINNALFRFPRLYRGGKLRNALYEISSLDDETFNEEDLIV